MVKKGIWDGKNEGRSAVVRRSGVGAVTMGGGGAVRWERPRVVVVATPKGNEAPLGKEKSLELLSFPSPCPLADSLFGFLLPCQGLLGVLAAWYVCVCVRREGNEREGENQKERGAGCR